MCNFIQNYSGEFRLSPTDSDRGKQLGTKLSIDYKWKYVSLAVLIKNRSQDGSDTQSKLSREYYKGPIFPTDNYRLEPTVTRTMPETISQFLPAVSALFMNSSIDIPSHDTPAVTGWCLLLDNHWRTSNTTVFSARISSVLARIILCELSDMTARIIHCSNHLYMGVPSPIVHDAQPAWHWRQLY